MADKDQQAVWADAVATVHREFFSAVDPEIFVAAREIVQVAPQDSKPPLP